MNDLLERKSYLSNLTEIPDMALYSLAWETLAEEFEQIGFLSNAAYCRNHAEHYAAYCLKQAEAVMA